MDLRRCTCQAGQDPTAAIGTARDWYRGLQDAFYHCDTWKGGLPAGYKAWHAEEGFPS
ncbi:MAG: hypothetical protein AB7S38_29690 [Vulcanimicrobiota bacterium]